jgi:hypothetical protein
MKGNVFILIGALCTLLSFGCAMNAADRDSSPPPATDEVEQGVSSCPGWEGCYKFCRLRFKCTTQAGCDALSRCLDQCDADFPGCF